MSKMYDPSRPNPKWENSNCISCKTVEGNFRYGIWICPACDDRIFIKPYGGYSKPEEIVSCISLRANAANTKYDELTVIYRFSQKDTLISAKKGSHSFPLLVLDGIMPMTEEFLTQVPSKIKLWLTFS